MNIYKIERTDEGDYDEYEGAVVVAESSQDARKIHPDPDGKPDGSTAAWVTPDLIEVQYIGKAGYKMKRGVVLADFRRG